MYAVVDTCTLLPCLPYLSMLIPAFGLSSYIAPPLLLGLKVIGLVFRQFDSIRPDIDTEGNKGVSATMLMCSLVQGCPAWL